MTVYISHEMRGKVTSNALEFGPLQVIVPAEQQLTENPMAKASIIDLIESTLSHYNDDDYLLLSGDPACIAVCFAVASLNNNGRVKVLKWDRLTDCSYPVNLKLDMGESDE